LRSNRNGPVDHFERRTPRAWASAGAAAPLACAELRDSLAAMRNIIPFRKKKRRLDWIQGVTPRKEQPRLAGRIPPALPGGLVILVMIAMMIWLF